VNLAEGGHIKSTDDRLAFLNRIYEFTSATDGAAYKQALPVTFPYVRLTPTVAHHGFSPVRKIEQWAPDYTSFTANSEHVYSPILNGLLAVANATAVGGIAQATGPLYKSQSSLFTTPFLVQDFGAKFIFQKQASLLGTKDASYNAFPPQLSLTLVHPAVPTAATPNQTFYVECGLYSQKAFDISAIFPPGAVTAHKPTATYFNYAVYSVTQTVSGSVRTDQTQPINLATFPQANAVFGKFGPLAQTVASNFYCHTIAASCASLHFPWPCTALTTPTPGPLAVVYRAYLNPQTGVAPSDFDLLKPVSANLQIFLH